MKLNEKTAEVLNDLIEINNDRIEGYERASRETESDDADLRALFNNMASESRRYVNELTSLVSQTGEEPAKGTTVRGKIYRAWMDVKATFSGHDRKAILASCEFGEDAAQRAYEAALNADVMIDPASRALIASEQGALKKSHDLIKKQRDVHRSLQQH